MKNVYSELIKAIEIDGAKKATAYQSENTTIKATLRSKDRSQLQILLTIGKPNYQERQFIKLCKKAGEKFPIKKIQLKFKKK